MVKTDYGSKIVNNFFTNLSNINIIKRHSRKTSLAAVFAEGFNRTIKDLLKKPVSQTADGNWVVIQPTKTKQ